MGWSLWEVLLLLSIFHSDPWKQPGTWSSFEVHRHVNWGGGSVWEALQHSLMQNMTNWQEKRCCFGSSAEGQLRHTVQHSLFRIRIWVVTLNKSTVEYVAVCCCMLLQCCCMVLPASHPDWMFFCFFFICWTKYINVYLKLFSLCNSLSQSKLPDVLYWASVKRLTLLVVKKKCHHVF